MAACAATASRNRKTIVRENFTLNMARKKLPALCVRRTRCTLVRSSERLQPGRTSGPDPLNAGPLVGPAYSRAGRAGWRTRAFEEEELKNDLVHCQHCEAIPETGGDEEPALSDTDEGSANTGAAARLAKLARSYLCITATSVPSGCVRV
ncbi:unnamed protein product [Pleuronectes platessa]|uniref:Uncharacterized protein n=1 Tax=Pleuronectes platessa TaxID=8262 RepID=A0A9N7VHS0_PLEPL|nr:unnamed protein product [Pleuronectes platessa]